MKFVFFSQNFQLFNKQPCNVICNTHWNLFYRSHVTHVKLEFHISVPCLRRSFEYTFFFKNWLQRITHVCLFTIIFWERTVYFIVYSTTNLHNIFSIFQIILKTYALFNLNDSFVFVKCIIQILKFCYKYWR